MRIIDVLMAIAIAYLGVSIAYSFLKSYGLSAHGIIGCLSTLTLATVGIVHILKGGLNAVHHR